MKSNLFSWGRKIEPSICITNYFQNNDVTVLSIEVDTSEGTFSADGVAKRHPADKHDSNIGDLTALADALDSLSRGLKRRAAGLTKHAEDVALDKELRNLKQVGEATRFFGRRKIVN